MEICTISIALSAANGRKLQNFGIYRRPLILTLPTPWPHHSAHFIPCHCFILGSYLNAVYLSLINDFLPSKNLIFNSALNGKILKQTVLDFIRKYHSGFCVRHVLQQHSHIPTSMHIKRYRLFNLDGCIHPQCPT